MGPSEVPVWGCTSVSTFLRASCREKFIVNEIPHGPHADQQGLKLGAIYITSKTCNRNFNILWRTDEGWNVANSTLEFLRRLARSGEDSADS